MNAGTDTNKKSPIKAIKIIGNATANDASNIVNVCFLFSPNTNTTKLCIAAMIKTNGIHPNNNNGVILAATAVIVSLRGLKPPTSLHAT